MTHLILISLISLLLMFSLLSSPLISSHPPHRISSLKIKFFPHIFCLIQPHLLLSFHLISYHQTSFISFCIISFHRSLFSHLCQPHVIPFKLVISYDFMSFQLTLWNHLFFSLPSHPILSHLCLCRGAWRSHQEDREGGDSDDGQRQSGGRIQRGGADWGDQEINKRKGWREDEK